MQSKTDIDLPMEILEEYKVNYDDRQDVSEEKNRDNEVEHRLLNRKLKSLNIAQESTDRRYKRERGKLERELDQLHHSARSQSSLKHDAQVREIMEQTKRARAKLAQSRKDVRRHSNPVIAETPSGGGQQRMEKRGSLTSSSSLTSRDVHTMRRDSLRTVGVLGGGEGSLAIPAPGGLHSLCHMTIPSQTDTTTTRISPRPGLHDTPRDTPRDCRRGSKEALGKRRTSTGKWERQ